MNTPDPLDMGRDDYAATYCPEDDKIRIYCGRVERATYDWLRSLGYTSTPKQDCDFVAVWTVAREDAALAMIDEADDIGDEDTTPEDRAADRADRFGGYRDRRSAEAHGMADRYEAGPSAYGNQNAARAERMAARRDRLGVLACSQWSKAEYWQNRTAGVIRHALHKSSASVRRGRILALEAEQRRHIASIEHAQARYDAWAKVRDMDDNAHTLTFTDVGGAFNTDRFGSDKPAVKLAYMLANSGGGGCDYQHPRDPDRRPTSLYSLMTDHENPITAAEAAQLAIGNRKRPCTDGDGQSRYAEHLALRLAYERQMLDAEGGTAGDVDMVPGGMIGRHLITKVNKSRATGAVVSVNVYAPKRDGEGHDYRRRGDTMLLNVQRFGESVYTPPTPDTLAQLAEVTKASKAKAKSKNAEAPKLINPTAESAEALQADLNAKARTPNAVTYLTQAEYTRRSGGNHSHYETVYLRRRPMLDRYIRDMYGSADKLPIVCKVRASWRGMSLGQALSVVVLTDKPQKPLPDWKPIEAHAGQPVAIAI